MLLSFNGMKENKNYKEALKQYLTDTELRLTGLHANFLSTISEPDQTRNHIFLIT